MMLAADTNIAPFSSFIVCILAVHLRLETGFIYIDELFFGNVFDFFLNMPLLVWGLFFVKYALFFA